MAEKFTPGEWVTRPGNTTVLDKKSNPIAMVYRAEYYRSKEESFANAALIKAAPEMYECICDALTDLEMPEGMRKHFESVLKKARGGRMSDLKPCPKCGSDKIKVDYRWDSMNLAKTYFVYCFNCDICFNGNYSEDSTIAKWNTRPPRMH